MTGRVQSLRSSTAGNRPTGRQPGELYVNFPDNQLGVINAANAAQDLLAVRFFSSLSSYVVGDYVVQAGQVYSAKVAVAPGAFNSTQWLQAGGNVVVSDTAPANPSNGALWFDSVGGQLYVSYADANSQQWVIATSGGGSAGSIPVASTTTPLASGTAAVGTSTAYARADHVHPASAGGAGLLMVMTVDGPTATTGQTVSLPAQAKFTAPANFFTVGKTLRAKIYGSYLNSTASANVFSVELRIGATGSVIAVPSQTTFAGANTKMWFSLEILLVCRTVGTSAAVAAVGNYIGAASSANFTVGPYFQPIYPAQSGSPMANGTAFDSTIANIIDIYLYVGSASANCNAALNLYTLEALN